MQLLDSDLDEFLSKHKMSDEMHKLFLTVFFFSLISDSYSANK